MRNAIVQRPRYQLAIVLSAAILLVSGCGVMKSKSETNVCGLQTDIPSEERLANTLKWTTASEEDNFGFDVYRGNTQEGEFERITVDPVLGAGTTDFPSEYQYRDDTIDPCKAYWYYVESISTGGTREKFTPVFRAKPKRSAEGE